ncbi:hypothetical protein ACDJ44_05745 [Proteus mirabilis]|uniref:hypothetical protein n=1 Tax=Proteus TaxID=583 RepID=UPI00019D007C|nr:MULTISPECIES: hypothetical protein [Proteus]AUU36068.1 hypothetical protein MC72_012120 [Proteus mirabilis]EEI48330.1 hypothetical protein HMPREF0693_1578 [Proteus mirabilis ATCC 29906]EKU3800876.1 hypothetical protein [Proteus mirabilis]ELA7711733.1 hypothetical protein [Proteus mirabilis]ELA9917636.1 hypothetical protein [Proteus mirabilis]
MSKNYYLSLATDTLASSRLLAKQLENIGDDAFKLAQLLASDKTAIVAEQGLFALKDLAK